MCLLFPVQASRLLIGQDFYMVRIMSAPVALAPDRPSPDQDQDQTKLNQNWNEAKWITALWSDK